MKTRSIMMSAALLSLAGILGLGCAASVGDEAADEAAAPAEEATVSEAAAAETCSWDDCQAEHQPCTCQNTGWSGFCGYGPIHEPCLYCHCD